MQKALKVLSVLIAAAAVIDFAAMLCLGARFMAAPIEPHPEAGQTVGWNNHGTLHYVTAQQGELFHLAFQAFIGLFFCLALTIYLQQRYKRRGPFG